MDLAIGLTRRPLRVGDALRILEVMDAYEIKLLSLNSRDLLLLINEYLGGRL